MQKELIARGGIYASMLNAGKDIDGLLDR